MIERITALNAEELLGHRLDRRGTYAFCDHTRLVQRALTVRLPCSGCTPGYEEAGNHNETGAGCSECRGHGIRLRHSWIPVSLTTPAQAGQSD